MVKILLFARLKELAGRSELDLELEKPIPLAGLWERLNPEFPQLMEWVDRRRVLVSVNQAMAVDDTVIHDGDEVGLMPPFSGGAVRKKPAAESPPGDWTRIQTEDFSLDDELRRIKAVSGRIGGVAVFIGTARDFSKGHPVTRLDYEHFAGLAEKTLAEIRRKALSRFEIIEVSLIHRTGTISIGGNIVLVLAAAEHRAEAFQACRWCIDELKATTPIWKRETTPEGKIWVEDRP